MSTNEQTHELLSTSFTVARNGDVEGSFIFPADLTDRLVGVTESRYQGIINEAKLWGGATEIMLGTKIETTLEFLELLGRTGCAGCGEQCGILRNSTYYSDNTEGINLLMYPKISTTSKPIVGTNRTDRVDDPNIIAEIKSYNKTRPETKNPSACMETMRTIASIAVGKLSEQLDKIESIKSQNAA